ncbi:MAG: hypothetical protein Q9180_002246 [Flavoplaca navasiana]
MTPDPEYSSDKSHGRSSGLTSRWTTSNNTAPPLPSKWGISSDAHRATLQLLTHSELAHVTYTPVCLLSEAGLQGIGKSVPVLFSIKKRFGKDKKKARDDDLEEPSRALPPPSPQPSTSGPEITPVPDGSRLSAPSTHIVPRPTPLGRLTSKPANLALSATSALPQRPRSRYADRRDDPLGLTIVHEPKAPPHCDVIFVHGLGGTSRATWAKGRDPDYCWPQEWLPVEPGIGGARILSFGYNANFAAAGPAPITGIADFARDLLYAMKYAKSEDLEELELGKTGLDNGKMLNQMLMLFLEQAYILGKDHPSYSDMVSSVRAMMFLATPHRGSNLAGVLNRILAVSFNHSPKLYVAELKNGSQTIEALNDQFRHIASRLKILSFFETLPTSVGPKKMMVVDKGSATMGYPDEISKSMNADHHTVCKFDNREDSDYISVRNALKSLITEICLTGVGSIKALAQAQEWVEQMQHLLGACENHQDDFEFFRKRWTTGTCDWILSHAIFNQWATDQEESPVMLWLHALPGSGKSILSSFIVNHLLEGSFCVYYFFRFGDQSKCSLSNCLKSTAYQIAEKFPNFRYALMDMSSSSKTLEKADPKTIWDKIFVGILFKLVLPTTMYWIIDAVDESDHPQLLVEMMQGVAKSTASIKILLVSRQNDDLISAFDRLSIAVPSVFLPVEDTKRDIRTCVEKEVQYMRASKKLKSMVIERMVAAAHGNFLWASLALVEVMRCNTQEDLDETLEAIPSGMEQLYRRMESTIMSKTINRPQDRRLGHTILTWATCSRRPLALDELTQALQPEFSIVVDLQFTISRVCGQFVIVDASGRLVMVHQTARDHIMTNDSALAVDPTAGHKKLFTKCLSVVEGQVHQRGTDLQSDDQGFLRYAVTSWAYHFNLTSVDTDEPLLRLVSFLDGKTVLAWIVSLAQLNQLKILVYSSKIMTLHVRRKRSHYRSTDTILHTMQELDLVESWATDFLKILGKFGPTLLADPSTIYQLIPPFCPRSSMIYQIFGRQSPYLPPLQVHGLTQDVWDDSLAKISLGPKTQTVAVVCSASQFAVVTGVGGINLYDSTTFDLQRALSHNERVCAISFSSCSNFLATYGFRTTKVWSVKTGSAMHQIRNPLGSRAFTITFTTNNTELVIGSNDRLIRVANLANANPTWSTLHEGLLKEDTTIDRPVHNMPWRMAFNSDASCVAVAYRGSPLCLWSLVPPKLIQHCMRSSDYAGNGWTVVDQVIWHPQSEELIGLYMGGHVFRWNPWEDTQQELQAYGSILASSPDGKFFAIGDNESVEDESDVVSEVASNRTAAVSEAVAQVRDQITAIGVQFSGKQQALGNESGTISLIDVTEGSHSPFQLCKSDVSLSITHLDWSSDGNYLAFAELTGKVVIRRVQLETDCRGSTASPIFEVKIPVSPEGIEQILLDKKADRLLVKNGPTVTVWSSIHVPDGEDNAGTSIMLPETKWIKHPRDSKFLLAFSPWHVQTYRWNDLTEVSTLEMQIPLFRADTQDSPKIDQLSPIDHVVRVGSISANASGSHLLIDTVKVTAKAQEHSTSILSTSTFTPILLPDTIQRLIEIPLGLLPKQRIIFLDKDHWMCSWRVGAHPATEKVQKYYCLPKDWLNVEYLKLCALLADGRFLIPNNGELAVIRSAAMSHW